MRGREILLSDGSDVVSDGPDMGGGRGGNAHMRSVVPLHP